MIYKFLRDAIIRHLDETLPLIDALDGNIIFEEPIEHGRPLGETVLHMLRSIEFYLTGLSKGEWTPLLYNLDKYDSVESIKELARQVFKKARVHIDVLGNTDLSRVIDSFSRPTTVGEILLEMIEHSLHHRGQLTVYYRLLGVEFIPIQYII